MKRNVPIGDGRLDTDEPAIRVTVEVGGRRLVYDAADLETISFGAAV